MTAASHHRPAINYLSATSATPLPRAHRPSAHRSRRLLAAVGVVSALVLAGCAGVDAPNRSDAADVAGPSNVAGSAAGDLAELPSSHVHAITVNPKDGQVYLATHDGLFIAGADGWTARGPNVDLMGFTVADSDHFYASGHPGEGTDLPSPVGLIESRDGGTTWTSLSRGGQSDFHTLTTSSGGIAGFDGQLRVSPDGTDWETGTGLRAAAFSLAGGKNGAVLATTELGLSASIDAGATWTQVDNAPLMLRVAWAAGETVAGIEPDGTVHVSTDGGRTWQERGQVEGQPEALGATGSGDELRILAVAGGSISESRDAGATFEDLQP